MFVLVNDVLVRRSVLTRKKVVVWRRESERRGIRQRVWREVPF